MDPTALELWCCPPICPLWRHFETCLYRIWYLKLVAIQRRNEGGVEWVGGGGGGGGVAPPNVVFVGKRGRLSENLCSSSSKENVWCDGRSTHFYISDNFYKKWRQNFEKLRKKIASSPTRLDHCPLKWQDLVKKIVMSVIAYSANVRQCVLSSVSSLALIDTLR